MRTRTLNAWIGITTIGLGFSISTACSNLAETQCSSDAECAVGNICSSVGICVPKAPAADGGPVLVTPPDSSSVSACSTTEKCTAENGGKPSICRAPGVEECINLQTDLCPQVIGDWQNPNSVILGSVTPLSQTTEKDVPLALATQPAKAKRLAIEEWNTAGGLPGPTAGQRRPLAMLLCDAVPGGDTSRCNSTDCVSAIPATKYLVDVVKVPAIITESASVTVSVMSVAVPGGVVVMSVEAGSSGLARIPNDNLLWQTIGGEETVASIQLKEAEIFEARIRTQLGLAPSVPIRIANISSQGSFGDLTATADLVESTIKFNGGVSAKDNAAAGNYLRVTLHDPFATKDGLYDGIARVVAFKPHIILSNTFSLDGFTYILPQVEGSWPSGQPRPYYIKNDFASTARFTAAIGQNEGLRQRFVGSQLIGLSGTDYDEALADYKARWEARFGPDTDGVGLDHTQGGDGFYSLAFAIAASGVTSGRVEGRSIVNGFAKLVGPGQKVRFRPGDIQSGLNALAATGKIDVVSVNSNLDWDLTTGLPLEDAAAWCINRNPSGTLSFNFGVSLNYSAKTKQYSGVIDPECMPVVP